MIIKYKNFIKGRINILSLIFYKKYIIIYIEKLKKKESVNVKCKPKWLYRLESKTPENGLWYNLNNNLVWGIGKIENCLTKDLPMGYDARYHKDGRNWFSSCSKKEDLLHWYSLQNALDLIDNGFVFARYLATEYVEYEFETTFIKDSCLKREEIDIKELFNEGE